MTDKQSYRAKLREVILAAEDRNIQKVEVPEWGCAVHVRVMGGSERYIFESAVNGSKGSGEAMRGTLVALCACDEEGERIFDVKDSDALNRKSAVGLDRVVSVALKINGLLSKDPSSKN